MKNYQVKLVENQYSAEEAKELCLSLINDKIKFLQSKIFSVKERLGADTVKLEMRVSELKDEKNRLLLDFGDLDDKEQRVEIDCHINLKIREGASVLV